MNTANIIKPRIRADRTKATFTNSDVLWSDTTVTWSDANAFWGGYDPKNAPEPPNGMVIIPKP